MGSCSAQCVVLWINGSLREFSNWPKNETRQMHTYIRNKSRWISAQSSLIIRQHSEMHLSPSVIKQSMRPPACLLLCSCSLQALRISATAFGTTIGDSASTAIALSIYQTYVNEKKKPKSLSQSFFFLEYRKDLRIIVIKKKSSTVQMTRLWWAR